MNMFLPHFHAYESILNRELLGLGSELQTTLIRGSALPSADSNQCTCLAISVINPRIANAGLRMQSAKESAFDRGRESQELTPPPAEPYWRFSRIRLST